MPSYFPFDPNPRKPASALPADTCDSQFHVFGPRDLYPVRPGAVYEMPTATAGLALALHKTLGITRGVIVQATTYGADHTVVLDGLKAGGPNYRGCANAIVFNDAPDAYLATLDQAGVRGARFSRASLGAGVEGADFTRAIERVAELGWYVKVQPEPTGIAGNIGPFENLRMPVVIDHMGRPDPAKGTQDPSLQKVLALLAKGNFWVMLSLGEKISKAGYPWDDVLPIARTLIEAAPDRIIWGSDWPHPVSATQPPNDGEIVDFLFRLAPDAVERQKILVDNPARLFGFAG